MGEFQRDSLSDIVVNLSTKSFFYSSFPIIGQLLAGRVAWGRYLRAAFRPTGRSTGLVVAWTGGGSGGQALLGYGRTVRLEGG